MAFELRKMTLEEDHALCSQPSLFLNFGGRDKEPPCSLRQWVVDNQSQASFFRMKNKEVREHTQRFVLQWQDDVVVMDAQDEWVPNIVFKVVFATENAKNHKAEFENMIAEAVTLGKDAFLVFLMDTPLESIRVEGW